MRATWSGSSAVTSVAERLVSVTSLNASPFSSPRGSSPPTTSPVTLDSREGRLSRPAPRDLVFDRLASNDEHRALRMVENSGGDAPEERALHRTPAVRAEHNELRSEFLSRRADRLDGEAAENHGTRPHAGLVRTRGRVGERLCRFLLTQLAEIRVHRDVGKSHRSVA